MIFTQPTLFFCHLLLLVQWSVGNLGQTQPGYSQEDWYWEHVGPRKGLRIPEKSDSNLIFAGSVLVSGREQLLLSVGNHVTVLHLVRGTSARLGSTLGRWNPVEQTGLCIYSCFRTYRSELFNRVLSNQQTAALTWAKGSISEPRVSVPEQSLSVLSMP